MKKGRFLSGKGRVLVRLWKYVLEHKLMLVGAIILTVAANVSGLLWPLLSGYAIEAVEPGVGAVDFDRVFYFAGLMLVFCVLSSVLSYILSILMVNLSQRVVFRLRKELFSKLSRLPVGYFDKFQSGDLISHVTYDIDTINTSVANDIVQICNAIITVIGSLAMMIYISPAMVLVVLFTLPASYIFTKVMTTKIKPLFRKRSAKLGKLNGFVEEMVSGHKTIKAYHREESVIGRFDKNNLDAVDAYHRAEYYGSAVGPSMGFINNISLSLVSIAGTVLYFMGALSIGNISSFVLYSRRFAGPINEIANIISELQSSIAAAERVFRIIDEKSEPPDPPDAVELEDVKGRVAFENVTFGYLKNKPVIKGLSFEAKAGELVAIVGKTGAGKTTLINLLMRFYDPDGGRITVDGIDIKNATRKSLRLSYAMVLQDTWLFHGTVYDNIAYGKKNASREAVEKVCKAANVHNFIKSLPKGYDTVISGEGGSISSGQKQLLTIARAMMLDAKMLILDEATSNVDTVTEKKIQNAMRELMSGKTCFVIAHRLSTIQNADTILVVSDGEIVEKGNHETLLEKKGTYAGLYYSQNF